MSGKKKSQAMIIGITGGIATGKSTVTAYLRSKRFTVICADEISHLLTRKNAKGWKAIQKKFGSDMLMKNQELDREKLAQLIFTNKKAKQQLENILHPMVRSEILKAISRAQKSTRHKLIFVDVPLLFESGFDKLCDVVMCVYSNQKHQIDRLVKVRRMTKSQALVRIKSQQPLKTKIQRSDIVIENNGTLRELHQILSLILGEL